MEEVNPFDAETRHITTKVQLGSLLNSMPTGPLWNITDVTQQSSVTLHHNLLLLSTIPITQTETSILTPTFTLRNCISSVPALETGLCILRSTRHLQQGKDQVVQRTTYGEED
jgi:hypothetical protein